jgi:hypothetical protein
MNENTKLIENYFETWYYTVSFPENDINKVLDFMKIIWVNWFRIWDIPSDKESFSYLQITIDTAEKVALILELWLKIINIIPIKPITKLNNFELV